MAKYNYIVVKQLFYKGESGFDIAMPTSASDIISFSNWDKAVEFVEEQMAYYLSAENHYEDKFELYDYDNYECKFQGVEKMRIYAQENYNYNDIRHCFRITKQKNFEI